MEILRFNFVLVRHQQQSKNRRLKMGKEAAK